jgi:hypothetical protein
MPDDPIFVTPDAGPAFLVFGHENVEGGLWALLLLVVTIRFSQVNKTFKNYLYELIIIFVAFMSLHILLCDEVLPYIALRVAVV